MANRTKPVMTEEVYKSTVAKDILTKALHEVSTKADEHGHTESSFSMIAELWTTYVKHAATSRGHMEISPMDVAQMMTMLKICRAVYGKSDDNFVDGAGYQGLAAMLQQDNSEEG